MPASEAQKRATQKYIDKNLESLYTRVPKGYKSVIKDHAASQGESVTEFVLRAINETMERDKDKNK